MPTQLRGVLDSPDGSSRRRALRPPACPPARPPAQDVYKPESVRLRRHLSAVVNFAKFREEKLVAYTEMQAHIDALLEERRVLEEENLAKVGRPCLGGCWGLLGPLGEPAGAARGLLGPPQAMRSQDTEGVRRPARSCRS